jgi:hypothetical protein
VSFDGRCAPTWTAAGMPGGSGALIEVGDLRARGLEQRVSFTDALSEGPVSGERDLDYYERRQRSREYMVELERRVSRVGGALKSTMARFARADGRRVVVAFTPGQPETAWSPSYSPIDFMNATARYPAQDRWNDVALEAADLGFTLYVVDTSAMRTSASRATPRWVPWTASEPPSARVSCSIRDRRGALTPCSGTPKPILRPTSTRAGTWGSGSSAPARTCSSLRRNSPVVGRTSSGSPRSRWPSVIGTAGPLVQPGLHRPPRRRRQGVPDRSARQG